MREEAKCFISENPVEMLRLFNYYIVKVCYLYYTSDLQSYTAKNASGTF